MEFIFTLKYRLPEILEDENALVERLGEGGCDDALVGIGQPGRLALEFSRKGNNARQVVYSALADVKRILPTATLVEALPDLVGLTDVAKIAGVSRQYMRKLMLAHTNNFPAPVHEGSASIWHLADVLIWLEANGAYSMEPDLLKTALATREVNQAREACRLPRKLVQELERLIA